ncbi:MAG: AI-2E family transporter, partial [Chloroflexia bacterium]|nr:AI-2E family transporter [Chloroflexia bacterium]
MALSPSSSREREIESTLTPGGRDRRPGITPASLFLVLLLAWVMSQIELVLILALLALVFGTIIERPVQKLEQRRVPRPAGILLIYIVLIGSLVLLSWIIVPGIADQAASFNDQVPDQLRELEGEWRTSGNPLLNGPGDQLLRQLIRRLDQPADELSPDAAQAAIPVITNVTAFVVSTLTLLVITFYYVMEKALLRRVLLDQFSAESRARVSRVWDDVEAKVGGWMRGQLLLCLIIGTLATVSYAIVDLRFWPLLGLWAGMTEIIPIVGPWIGGVPAVIIALTMSPEKAIIVTGIILGMQTLENWVLVPRVMRGAVGLTPLTVFVAILAGTQLMGVIGAVLAIPIAATVQVILTDYLDVRRGKRSAADPMSGWRWMLTRSGREQATHEEGDNGVRADAERPRATTAGT